MRLKAEQGETFFFYFQLYCVPTHHPPSLLFARESGLMHPTRILQQLVIHCSSHPLPPQLPPAPLPVARLVAYGCGGVPVVYSIPSPSTMRRHID